MTLSPQLKWLLEQDPFVMFWVYAIGFALIVALSQPSWTRKRK